MMRVAGLKLLAEKNPAAIGRSARLMPDSRSETRQYLDRVLTPSANPAGDVLQRARIFVQDDRGDIRRQLADVHEQHPAGSPAAFDWLKSQAESGQVLSRRPLESFYDDRVGDIVPIRNQVPVSGFDNDPNETGWYGTAQRRYAFPDNLEIEEGELNGAEIENRVTVNTDPRANYTKASILAHELGHVLQGHTLNTGKLDIPQKEAEAEAIRYGAINRLYPWRTKSDLDSAALYPLREADQVLHRREGIPIEGLPRTFQNLTSAHLDFPAYRQQMVTDHLSNPEIQDQINSAAAAIVPVPRQPFRGIITPDPARVNSVRDAYVQEQMAEDRYKARMDELYSQGLYQ